MEDLLSNEIAAPEFLFVEYTVYLFCFGGHNKSAN